MRIDVHHYHHGSADSGNAILERLNIMSAQMDALEAQVTATKTVTDSAIVLLQGLRQQIIDAGTDQGKLTTLTDSLRTETDELAAAVTANTPAA